MSDTYTVHVITYDFEGEENDIYSQLDKEDIETAFSEGLPFFRFDESPDYKVDVLEMDGKTSFLNRFLDEGMGKEYSCRVGMCLACSARVVRGETFNADRGLNETEAEFFNVTCMGRPQSDAVLEAQVYPPSVEIDLELAETEKEPADFEDIEAALG